MEHDVNTFIDSNTKLTSDSIRKKIYDSYSHYYQIFINSKDKINQNNKDIYFFIKEYIKDITLVNNNYHNVCNSIILDLQKKFKYAFTNSTQRNIEFLDIVDNILKSIYSENWNTTKNEILNKAPCTIQDPTFIEQIRNNQYLFDENNNDNQKKIFEEKIKNVELKGITNRNIISRFVYKNLGDNINKLPSNVITEIINKSFDCYSSYYRLKEKGIKCNLPKYLDKTSKYNLIFSKESFKIKNGYARLTVGENIAKNFNEITENKKYQMLNENDDTYYKKYVNNKFLIKKEGKISKGKNFIVDDKYINKDNNKIFDAYYLNIKVPEKLKDKKIKRIEIVPVYDGYRYKICFTYVHKIVEVKEKITEENTISIDLGMTNLMSIYDPNGEAKLIKGGYINSVNSYYNYRIDQEKSKAKILFNKYTSDRVYDLLIKRENKINSYFDNVVKWIYNNYKDKNIIMGYNEGWKTNVGMGKVNNRKFYNIPYSKLLKKLRMKFGERLIIKEESYTSKCDALGLEKIGKKGKYMGEREKRGLYSSSTKKLINADINGAINIMRKVINLKEVRGKVLNPRKINIFSELSPAKQQLIR
jgi:IS605 OrfB family transposase